MATFRCVALGDCQASQRIFSLRLQLPRTLVLLADTRGALSSAEVLELSAWCTSLYLLYGILPLYICSPYSPPPSPLCRDEFLVPRDRLVSPTVSPLHFGTVNWVSTPVQSELATNCPLLLASPRFQRWELDSASLGLEPNPTPDPILI